MQSPGKGLEELDLRRLQQVGWMMTGLFRRSIWEIGACHLNVTFQSFL